METEENLVNLRREREITFRHSFDKSLRSGSGEDKENCRRTVDTSRREQIFRRSFEDSRIQFGRAPLHPNRRSLDPTCYNVFSGEVKVPSQTPRYHHLSLVLSPDERIEAGDRRFCSPEPTPGSSKGPELSPENAKPIKSPTAKQDLDRKGTRTSVKKEHKSPTVPRDLTPPSDKKGGSGFVASMCRFYSEIFQKKEERPELSVSFSRSKSPFSRSKSPFSRRRSPKLRKCQSFRDQVEERQGLVDEPPSEDIDLETRHHKGRKRYSLETLRCSDRTPLLSCQVRNVR